MAAVYPSYIWSGLKEEDAKDTLIDCRIDGLGFKKDTSFKIDLENNMAVPVCYGEKGASSVTIKGIEAEPWQIDAYRAYRDSLFAASVIYVSAPNSWEMIDGLKITHLDDTVEREVKATLAPYMVRSIAVPKGDTQGPYVNGDPLRVVSRGLANIGLPEAELALRSVQRLRQFDLKINDGATLVKLDLVALKTSENLLKNFQFERDTKRRDSDDKCGFTSLKNGKLELVFCKEHDPTVGQIQAEGFQITLFSGPATEGDEEYFIKLSLHDSRRPGQLLELSKLLDPENASLDLFCGWKACPFVAAELFLNRYLIVWVQGRNAAVIVDVDERKLISVLDGLPSPDVMQRISLSRDLKTLVKLDADGGFQVIALKPAQKDAEGHLTQDSTKVQVLLSGRIVDDEVVVWTPSGQFDSTAEGASHVAVRFPGRSGQRTTPSVLRLGPLGAHSATSHRWASVRRG